MSTSAELKIGEAFKDKVFLIETATGNPHLLQNPTCTIIDESGNRAVGVVAEESDGWYTCPFTPDAAGTWSTEWANADSTIYHAFKEFKVGTATIAATYDRIGAPTGVSISADIAAIKAETADILTDTGTTLDDLVDDLETRLTAARAGYLDELAAANIPADVDTLKAAVVVIDEFHDVPLQNAAQNAQMNEVIGNKTDTAAGTSLVSLAVAIKAKTDNLPADPADDSDLDTQLVDIEGKVDDLEGYHTVPAQNSANNSQVRDVVGNKTDTTAGNSVIAILKQILEDTGTTLDDLVDGLETRLSNNLVTRTWFSDTDDSITCNTDSTDLTLPSVVLPNIAGTIVSAYAGIKFRMIENTNAGTNGLNGAQDVQVKESAAGAYTDAINLADNQWLLAASTREGGDCVVGDIDIVGQVAAFNKTYNFMIDNNDVDQASLVLNDVQTFLIVSYY